MSAPMKWSWQDSWQTRSGEDVYFWEPLPFSLSRMVMDPSRQRAAAMLGLNLAIHAGMSAITYWATKQAYRSMAGLAFEAFSGQTVGQFIQRHPSTALFTSAYVQREIWQSLGDEKTGSVHFSGAGDIGSGGSMPGVPSLPSRSDWELFIDRNF